MHIFSRTLVGGSGINGDDFYTSSDGRVLVIADGASGAYDKVAASSLCIKAVKEFESIGNIENAKQFVENCIYRANNYLVEKSQRDRKLTFGTLTMAVVDNEDIIIGAVGDTPAFLISGSSIKKLVKPKKIYSNGVEHGVINEEEAEKAISSLPGIMHSMFLMYLPMVVPNISYFQGKAKTGDYLLICTDGISDWISESEIVKLLTGNDDLNEIGEEIYALVIERCPRDRMDDATMILAKI